MLESQVALAVVALEDGRSTEAESEAQSVIRSLGQTTAVCVRSPSSSRLAPGWPDTIRRARLERWQPPRRCRSGTERLSLKSELAMVEAEVEAAEGHTDDARQRLNALGATLRQSGLVLHELERRLLVLRIDRAEGRARRSGRCGRSGKRCAGAWGRPHRQARCDSSLTASRRLQIRASVPSRDTATLARRSNHV